MDCLFTDHRCIRCLFSKHSDTEKLNLDEERKTLYLKELMKVIFESTPHLSSPEITEKITSLQRSFGITVFDYTDTKKHYNELLLAREEVIKERIRSAKDPLYTAVAYAFTGNYIDFGALSDITEEKLYRFIDGTEKVSFDRNEFEKLAAELTSAKKLVYLTDNCGEIVFDKILIGLLKEMYPQLEIHAVVRGFDVLNDATEADARQVGLDKIVPVTANGTGVAGTVLSRISQESLQLIESADLIIAKGMGNFETLRNCKLNVYYMFLCKCERFCKMFNAEKFAYMLLNEKRIQAYPPIKTSHHYGKT